MHFNEAKFEVLQFWADMSAAPDILYVALDGGNWDLGVQVGIDFMFSAQVDHAVAADSAWQAWSCAPSGTAAAGS